MAAKYWVGGNGTWNSSSNASWSSTSGGTAANTTTPGPSDDVFFDVSSNVGTTNWTVTLGVGAACSNFNVTRLDGQLTFNLGTLYTNTLTVYGSVSVSTTATSLYYSSTTPSYSAVTYQSFTTTNFIKIGFTATSVTKYSDILSSKVTLGSNQLGETPIFPQVLSTSLAFIPNNALSLPAIPIRVIENFGESSSNTISPIPYQIWG